MQERVKLILEWERRWEAGEGMVNMEAKDLLHAGRVRDVIQQVRSTAELVEDKKDRTKVENVATYFEEHAGAVNYNYFKEQGWPQGSGAVEGGTSTSFTPSPSEEQAGS